MIDSCVITCEQHILIIIKNVDQEVECIQKQKKLKILLYITIFQNFMSLLLIPSYDLQLSISV